MEIRSIFLSTILLFAIIYFAVRLAIIPLVNRPEEVFTYKQDFGLVKLRDIDVISPTELDEIVELYQKKGAKNENYEQYQRYEKVLNELKWMEYFTNEEYLGKMDKLKKYFKVD